MKIAAFCREIGNAPHAMRMFSLRRRHASIVAHEKMANLRCQAAFGTVMAIQMGALVQETGNALNAMRMFFLTRLNALLVARSSLLDGTTSRVYALGEEIAIGSAPRATKMSLPQRANVLLAAR